MIKPEHLARLTCTECSKKENCKKPCIFIDKLAGKEKSCRELIPPPIPPDNAIDYKDILLELQEARHLATKISIADIRSIDNVRIRAIAAMSYAHIGKADQARMLDISTRTIERIAGLK